MSDLEATIIVAVTTVSGIIAGGGIAIASLWFSSYLDTLLNEQGYNRDWIERQLAHGERNGVRAAYNYAEYLPERRRMMQEWADYLDTLKVS